jgi:hypothetical protein
MGTRLTVAYRNFRFALTSEWDIKHDMSLFATLRIAAGSG